MVFILPSKKKRKDAQAVRSGPKHNIIKLRELTKVMGNFSWAIPSVLFTQAHSRKFQTNLIWMQAEF
jgi:hypothetical protein